MGLWAPLTHVPVRQWVLSLPIPLRLLRKRGLEATLTGQGKPKQLLTSGGGLARRTLRPSMANDVSTQFLDDGAVPTDNNASLQSCCCSAPSE